MWLEPLSHWFLSVALLAQVGSAPPPAMPQLRTTHTPLFAIPFLIRGDDPARQPVEVQLLVSTDRGAHWQFYARAQPADQRFMFHAGADGEYWFAIRTVDRAGQTRPETIAGPGLRVLVDAKQKPADAPIVTKMPPPTSLADKLDKPAIDANPSPGKEPNGSVAIAINPAIGKDLGATDEKRELRELVPGLPPGERPRMVNSRLFELEYDVDSVGPSGIGRVELWGTRDGGQTWSRFATDNDNRSPLRVHVDEEGIYGFRVVVTNGAGLGGAPPKRGDLPDLWIGVDLTKPTARIISAQQGTDAEAGHVIISWQADDKMLAARPISLSFSQARGGPWLPIASGLENTGRYAWPIDSRSPAQFYLRLEVRDEAGNTGVHETPESVTIDQSRPTIRVREVRPIGQTSARPVRRS